MSFGTNFNYSLRLLAKDKGLTAVCLIVITLGIAVTTLVYSAIYEFRYKSPPFPDGDRFVVVKTNDIEKNIESINTAFNAAGFLQIQERTTQFDTLGAFDSVRAVISDEGQTHLTGASITTPNLLALTKVKPILGRLLTEQDIAPSAQAVAVISTSLWKSYYAEDPNIIGTSTRINGSYYTIVGIMPDKFYFPYNTQNIWLPLSLSPASQLNEVPNLAVVGKLSKNGSKSQASKEVSKIISEWVSGNPDLYTNLVGNVKNYATISTGGASLAGDLLLAVGLAIFAIACLNLSTLMFLRASARQQELATRSALGASPWQLVKHVLLESLILCFFGATLAIGVAALGMELLQLSFLKLGSQIGGLPESFDLSLKMAGVIVALIMTISIWLSSSFVTAYRISKQDVTRVLESGGKGATSSGRSITTRTIVFVEMVVSIFLLLVCGLLVGAISEKQDFDYGTETANIAIGQFQLVEEKYQDINQRSAFIENLTFELESAQDIESVGFTTALPSVVGNRVTYALEDRDLKSNNLFPQNTLVWVDENYFEVMGVKLLAGRQFLPTDDEDSNDVVIVDQQFAELMWPGEEVIGERIQINPDANNSANNGSDKSSEWLTVVGVVEHIVQATPMANRENWTSLYRPIQQNTPSAMYVVAKYRQGVEDSQIFQLLRSATTAVDRNIPVTYTSTLDNFLSAAMADWGIIGDLTFTIAVAAFILSIIGIYGLIYRSVVTRFSELGIRRALGSNNNRIGLIFIKQGFSYLLVGFLIGGTAGVVVSSIMADLFPDILEYLLLTLTMLVLTIGTLIFLASYLPARKAIAMEPGDALRYD